MSVSKRYQALAAMVVLCLALCFFCPAARAETFEGLPGRELWQPYLNAAPQSLKDFADDPLRSALKLLPEAPMKMLRRVAKTYTDTLLFLALAGVLSLLVGESADRSLLELAVAVGCGTLLWGDLVQLAQLICEKMQSWQSFLTGFLPVYGGVLAAGGETVAGAAASGALLAGLSLLAQAAAVLIQPLLQSYLAISMACCIGTQRGLAEACSLAGKLLRKGLSVLGRCFAVLLGLQRAATLQLDRTTLHLGQLAAGSVPVIGQALSGTAEVLLTGMQLLKSTLGFAALAVLASEFLPLYLELLLHMLFLAACTLLCDLTESRRCRVLLACMTEAVHCMAAITALYFELITVGVVLLMAVGGG